MIFVTNIYLSLSFSPHLLSDLLYCFPPTVLLLNIWLISTFILVGPSQLFKKREHQTHELPKELHWLPINQRHIFKILLLIHKSLNGKGPNYLKEMLSPKPDPCPLRSSSEQLLDISRTNLITYGDRAFSIFGPRKWNALPLDIRWCTSISGFKKTLKSYLFRIAYPIWSQPM